MSVAVFVVVSVGVLMRVRRGSCLVSSPWVPNVASSQVRNFCFELPPRMIVSLGPGRSATSLRGCVMKGWNREIRERTL